MKMILASVLLFVSSASFAGEVQKLNQTCLAAAESAAVKDAEEMIEHTGECGIAESRLTSEGFGNYFVRTDNCGDTGPFEYNVRVAVYFRQGKKQIYSVCTVEKVELKEEN